MRASTLRSAGECAHRIRGTAAGTTSASSACSRSTPFSPTRSSSSPSRSSSVYVHRSFFLPNECKLTHLTLNRDSPLSTASSQVRRLARGAELAPREADARARVTLQSRYRWVIRRSHKSTSTVRAIQLLFQGFDAGSLTALPCHSRPLRCWPPDPLVRWYAGFWTSAETGD